MTVTDSHFKRTRLSVEEPVGRVKRRFAAAAGGSARFSGHFRAGADASVAARGQAGGGRHEPARRRPQTSDVGGYQAMASAAALTAILNGRTMPWPRSN